MAHFQMIMKLVGGGMALAGGCGCGLWMAAARKKRICVLRELEQAMVLMAGEIEYAAADILEILEKLAGKTWYLSDFFQSIYEVLAVKEGTGLYEIWRREMVRSPVYACLETADREVWQEIGMHLGTLDRQTQLRTLCILQERLQRRIQEAENAYHSQARIYRLVGITGGVFTVILLL